VAAVGNEEEEASVVMLTCCGGDGEGVIAAAADPCARCCLERLRFFIASVRAILFYRQPQAAAVERSKGEGTATAASVVDVEVPPML